MYINTKLLADGNFIDDFVQTKDLLRKEIISQVIFNSPSTKNYLTFHFMQINSFYIKPKRGLFHVNEWHEQISYSNIL